MDEVALRDHALAMLKTMIVDLRTPQTDAQKSAKSKGDAGSPAGGPETAAEIHGAGRAEDGFTIGQMVSEYRALRASVIRLWTEAKGTLAAEDFDDLTRFNETIDQAVAESVNRFSENVDRSRDLFVAILGHDLRTPISAVITGSESLIESGELSEQARTITVRTLNSAQRMNRVVADLLDFTRGKLGSGLQVTPEEIDLGNVVRGAIDESMSAHPRNVIQFSASGDLRVTGDPERLSQLLANLLMNAVQHGDGETSINVTALGEDNDVVLRVHNCGLPISPPDLRELFSPFKRLKSEKTTSPGSNDLGLGLYIAERIVAAHGGTIDVRSSAEAGTLFTARLPRNSDEGMRN